MSVGIYIAEFDVWTFEPFGKGLRNRHGTGDEKVEIFGSKPPFVCFVWLANNPVARVGKLSRIATSLRSPLVTVWQYDCVIIKLLTTKVILEICIALSTEEDEPTEKET